MNTRYGLLASPIGELLISVGSEGLEEICFDGRFDKARRSLATPEARNGAGAVLAEVTRQLTLYFRGELKDFELPLAPAGTPFQRRVWEELRAIPYGDTISYGELARRIGKPTAARAVGAANGRNPIPIVVPCHRVIGADGGLTGFGGGLEIKESLLAHEWEHR